MTRAKSENRSLKYFLKRLNGFLEADDLQMTVFDRTLDRFAKRFDPKIAVIDFKYFDERRLKKVRREIDKQERLQNFGYRRNLRKLEVICQKYIEIRKLTKIEKSRFLFEDCYLMYCHCGNSKNDRQILFWVLQDERYVKLNIRG